MKETDAFKRLIRMLPPQFLLAKQKSFVQPHLYYNDVIYDQPNNKSIIQKFENIQCAFFYLVNNLQAAHIIQVCKNKNYSKNKKKKNY